MYFTIENTKHSAIPEISIFLYEIQTGRAKNLNIWSCIHSEDIHVGTHLAVKG
jgi:hypothetical protein